jgi:hypothetical protein
MALFNFTLTDAFIGTSIGPADGGYLVSVRKVQSSTPQPYEVPCWNEGGRHWVSSYCQLRGARDVRDVYCHNPSQDVASPVGGASIQYLGQLQVQCLPRGSVYELTLSDAPLTEKELAERGRAQERKALEDHIVAVRGAKETARRAKAMLDATRAPV